MSGGPEYYPAFLDLRRRRAVVIGGGAVAAQKVRGLLEAGARVTVVSPDLSGELEVLTSRGAIEAVRRSYQEGDLAGAAVAIAATDDRSTNRMVWEEAERRGVLLNAVDDVSHCHFIAPSVHRRGGLTVAVSSGGRSPALAVRLRQRIAHLVREEHARLADLLGSLREEITCRVPDPATRTRLWYDLVDSDLLEYLRRGDQAGALARVERLLGEALGEATEPASEACVRQNAANPGVVYLVGAGPGDPGLITTRGLELLRTADVVLYDRLVSSRLLEQARPGAQLIPVGKHGHGYSVSQERINRLLVDHARRGRRVVRLKGGDPFVFGRGAEECAALRQAGIPFEVVPGVSAAVAVPAAAGIPVTHRRYASGFAVVTGHQCGAESELDWGALARMPTLVVLMGLRALPQVVARLLQHGARANTPAAVVASGTLPDQRVVTGTLATIATGVSRVRLESPATLIVGEVVGARVEPEDEQGKAEPAEARVAAASGASP